MSITRTIEVNDLTPAELAELFCEMDSHQQTEFFETINGLAAKWPGAGWCQQSCSIADSMTSGARFVIEKLAEHVLGYDETLAALQSIADLPGEINQYNYDHDDVIALNDAHIEAYQIATAALAKARGAA